MNKGKMQQFMLRSVVSLCCLLPAMPAVAKPDASETLLQQLSDAAGASGFEKSVRKILYPTWKKDLKSFKVDGIGNVSGVIPGRTDSPKVLLMAHMDEVGFIVRNITPEGFLQVEPDGGWRDQDVYAQRWKIMTSKGPVIGYSGEESSHLVPKPGQVTDASAAKKLHAAREMYIDVGARSRKEAMEKFGLRPGLPITPDTKFMVLNNTNRYLGKAFDDRVGVALVTELIEKFSKTSHPNQVAVAATVQEEIGLRGAHNIADQYKPNVTINIESCIAGDHPRTATPSNAVYPSLGKGPCIYVYERTMLPNNELVEWVVALAKKNNIPFQYATAPNYGQDASVVQQTGEGMPAILIGVPVRYAHQQSGVIERSDYDATLKLLTVMLKKLDNKQVKLMMPS